MSEWKEVISMTFPSEAHIVQGYLESEGICSILKDELTTQVNMMYSNALGGVKVLVMDDEFENAILLLEKGGYINPESTPKIEVVYLTSESDKKHCPYCHSENIGKKKSPDVIMLIVSLLLGFLFPIFRRTNLCFDCQKEWIFKKK